MDFMETVKNRYSCKKFDGRPVPQDKLDAILEAGRLAPTAKNLRSSTSMWPRPPRPWPRSTGSLPAGMARPRY